MSENPLARLLDACTDVGPGGLTFVGGSIDATEAALDRLLGWLGGEGGRWSFREWTDRVRLEEGVRGADGDVERLVAGRWFGAPGDLELWREGERFRWRFVGDAGARAPEGVRAETDFFAVGGGAAPVLRARGEPETALLWSAADARAATADAQTLRLLHDRGELELRLTTYYDRGVAAAVRYRELVAAAHAAGPHTPA